MRQGLIIPEAPRPAVKLAINVPNDQTLPNLEAANALIAPRKMDQMLIFRPWGSKVLPTAPAYTQAATALGIEIILTLRPIAGVNGSDGTLHFASTGAMDATLLAIAEEFKAWPHDLTVRLAHEFNGNWQPWGNGKESPAEYIAGWKYIVNFMAAAGVTNVKWCWCANVWPSSSTVDPTPFYPGDDYVNYVGMDGYMFKKTSTVKTFGQLYKGPYETLAALSPHPLMINEVAVAEDPERYSKPAWLEEIPDVIDDFPRLESFGYFHRDQTEIGEGNLEFNTTPASLAAFVAIVNNPPFTAEPTTPTLSLLHEDDMTAVDQTDVWGLLQAQSAARITLVKDGTGDLRPKGNGDPQSNTNFRRVELLAGDVFQASERAELGANESRYGTNGGLGTFALFKEGSRRRFWESLRLSAGFPIANINWQIITQMKQTQPYTKDTSGKVILELACRQSQFQVLGPPSMEAAPLAVYPAKTGRWIRFMWDVFFSHTPGTGWVELLIDDRAGASTFEAQWSSGKLYPPEGTLTSASGAQAGAEWAYADKAPIPSHPRIGIYRNPIIATQEIEAGRSGNAYVDVDNVQDYAII